jgi:hypothetical protein
MSVLQNIVVAVCRYTVTANSYSDLDYGIAAEYIFGLSKFQDHPISIPLHVQHSDHKLFSWKIFIAIYNIANSLRKKCIHHSSVMNYTLNLQTSITCTQYS